MKIRILDAGAIGSYLAAPLVRAPRMAVSLIAHATQPAVIRKRSPRECGARRSRDFDRSANDGSPLMGCPRQSGPIAIHLFQISLLGSGRALGPAHRVAAGVAASGAMTVPSRASSPTTDWAHPASSVQAGLGAQGVDAPGSRTQKHSRMRKIAEPKMPPVNVEPALRCRGSAPSVVSTTSR